MSPLRLALCSRARLRWLEIATSIFAYFVPQQVLLEPVQAITRMELTEDPRDFAANYLLHATQGLSVSSQHFTAFYLLSHGVIKLWLIIGLWRKKLGYYPAAIAVFGLFILYWVYRYRFTHSLSLLLITALAVVVIGLTWLEYQHLRRRLPSGRKSIAADHRWSTASAIPPAQRSRTRHPLTRYTFMNESLDFHHQVW